MTANQGPDQQKAKSGFRIPRAIDIQGLLYFALIVAAISPVQWYWRVLIFVFVFAGAYAFLYGWKSKNR